MNGLPLSSMAPGAWGAASGAATPEASGKPASPTLITPATWPLDNMGWYRSEEHTSELQSLRHLVCRLLLEKKKKKEQMNESLNASQASGRYGGMNAMS